MSSNLLKPERPAAHQFISFVFEVPKPSATHFAPQAASLFYMGKNQKIVAPCLLQLLNRLKDVFITSAIFVLIL